MDLQADLGQMKQDAREISNAAKEYEDAVTQLYNIVDNLSSSWQGVDNIAFVNTVNNYKKEIQTLGQVVNNYAIFLDGASNSLDDLQGDVGSAATKL